MSTESDTQLIIVAKRRRCLCGFQENRRVRWDLLIMVLAIFSCIQVPYQIAFLENRDTGTLLYVFNQIVDFIFILDVIISFRTTYINEETGIEVKIPKQIAIQYLKGECGLRLYLIFL